jgi:hypothetical protein
MNRLRKICVLLCSSVIVFFCAGCWTITPPPKAMIADPVPVFIADYGEHSAVLLPQSPNVYVEYSFGDWAYSAENYDSAFNAIAALFMSLQSSLGRTFTPMEPHEPYPLTVRRPVRIARIYASAEKVAKVVKEMDDRYRSAKSEPLYNPENQAFFVKDRQHYWLFNNCNTLTQRIVRKLGCESTGIVYIADYTLKEQK